MTVAITRTEQTPEALRRQAGRTSDARAARRMLALALVMEGQSRDAAARQCGMDRQTLRDWAHGGGAPAKLTAAQKATVAEWVRTGPDHQTDGVVRWRVIDLRQRIV